MAYTEDPLFEEEVEFSIDEGQTVCIGDLHIEAQEFCRMIELYLTQHDCGPNDPRAFLVEKIKNSKMVYGEENGCTRYHLTKELSH